MQRPAVLIDIETTVREPDGMELTTSEPIAWFPNAEEIAEAQARGVDACRQIAEYIRKMPEAQYRSGERV